MSKKAAATPKAPKADMKIVKRSKRNAMERKCLPKALKVMYCGSSPAMFRSVTETWKETRKKVSINPM